MRLVKHDKDVLTRKFTLAEVLEQPKLVIETITAHLRDISFHNLPRVNALYRAALDVDFFKMIAKDDVAALERFRVFLNRQRFPYVERLCGQGVQSLIFRGLVRPYVRPFRAAIGLLALMTFATGVT